MDPHSQIIVYRDVGLNSVNVEIASIRFGVQVNPESSTGTDVQDDPAGGSYYGLIDDTSLAYAPFQEGCNARTIHLADVCPCAIPESTEPCILDFGARKVTDMFGLQQVLQRSREVRDSDTQELPGEEHSKKNLEKGGHLECWREKLL